MRCDEFELRLNEVLDERLPMSSAADIQHHIRLCADCRKIARSYDSMIAGLQTVSLPAEPVGLTSRIVKEAQRPAYNSPRPKILVRPSRVPIMALAAAVVLLAIGLAWLGRQSRNDETPIGSGGDKLLAHVEKLPADGQSPSHVDEGSTGTQFTDQLETGASLEKDPSDTGLVGSIPATEWAQPGAEWAQGVADGLQPVTKPTVGAINGFLNLWGVGPKGRRS